MEFVWAILALIAATMCAVAAFKWVDARHRRKAWENADKEAREEFQRRQSIIPRDAEFIPKEVRPMRPTLLRHPSTVRMPRSYPRTTQPSKYTDDTPGMDPSLIALGTAAAVAIITSSSSESKADEAPAANRFESGGGDFGGSGSTTSYSPDPGGSTDSGGGGSVGGGGGTD